MTTASRRYRSITSGLRRLGCLAAVCGILALVLAGCRNPTVVEYEPYESPGALAPGDPNYGLQWHYGQIKMPEAWAILEDLPSSFSPVTVAVLDSPFDTDHEDLEANLTFNPASPSATEGYDFYYDDNDPTVGGASPAEHGSHVAGTIAAVTDNGVGVSGVGWNMVTALPVQVFDDDGNYGYGTLDVLVQAIYYASGEPNGSGVVPSSSPRVINMSLGFGGVDTAVYDAIDAAVANGITVVASAGNRPDFTEVASPAAYDNTIAVAATNEEGLLASYSVTGTEVDFAAPGGDEEASVWSTVVGDYGGELWYGTSMAAPHVTGVVGLLYSYAPNLNQDAVYAVLANTVRDLGEPGHDEQHGHGLIDAAAALEYLINAGRDYPVQPLGSGDSDSGDATTASLSAGAVSQLAAEGKHRGRGTRPQQRRGAIMPRAGDDIAPSSVIVKLTADAAARGGVAAARSLAHDMGEGAAAFLGGRLYRIDLGPGADVPSALQALGSHHDVEYAQPNFRYRIIQ